MSISERAKAGVTEMPERERPISERYRLLAAEFREMNKAAKMYDENKKRELASIIKKIRTGMPEIPHNRAEVEAMSTHAWGTYLEKMVQAEVDADYLRHMLKALEFEHSEWMMATANARRERHMGRQAT